MMVSINFNDEETAMLNFYAEEKNISIQEAVKKAVRNAAYLAKLDRADEQIRNGQVVVKTMEELEAMAE